MTPKPYPSILRICAVSALAGHVVGTEDNVTIIETGTQKISFHADRTITDTAGARISADDAVKLLGITL